MSLITYSPQQMYCVLMIILFHYQESALHKAAQNDHQEVAELLLSFKASIDDKNEVYFH